jgi:hypothetical protein
MCIAQQALNPRLTHEAGAASRHGMQVSSWPPMQPVAFFDLLDTHPGRGTQGFAFDGNLCFSDLLNDIGLLSGRKDVLDKIYRNAWHFTAPV